MPLDTHCCKTVIFHVNRSGLPKRNEKYVKPWWRACFPDHCPCGSPPARFWQAGGPQRSLPRKRSLPFLTRCQIAHPGYIVTKHVVAWLPREKTSPVSISIIAQALWGCCLWGKWRIFYLWSRKGGLGPKGYSGVWREGHSLLWSDDGSHWKWM